MKELSLALLILAGVSASKCTVHAKAPGKPRPICVARTAAIQYTDLDGIETVTTYKFYECDEGARPQDRAFKPLCHLEDNPFMRTVYAERRDWRDLEFLCSSELAQ